MVTSMHTIVTVLMAALLLSTPPRVMTNLNVFALPSDTVPERHRSKSPWWPLFDHAAVVALSATTSSEPIW